MMQKPEIIFTSQEEKWVATLDIDYRITWLAWLHPAGRNWFNRLLRIKGLGPGNQTGETVVKLEIEADYR